MNVPSVFANLIGHHIYHGGDLPPVASAYDYVMAGNGLFIRAASPAMSVCLALHEERINGLPEMEPYVNLPYGRIPESILTNIYEDARQRAFLRLERMYYLHRYPERVIVNIPRQKATSGAVTAESPTHGYKSLVCELHSHHQMEAFWSAKDDADEQEFRFYGVIGRLNTDSPTFRLRIGISGYFFEAPPTTIFTGEGPFNKPAKKEVHQAESGVLFYG